MAAPALRVVPAAARPDPTVADRLHDVGIRHSIDIERYSNQVVEKMIALLNRVDDDLLAKLAVQFEKMGRSSSVMRLDELLTAVRDVNVVAYRRISRELTAELKEFTGVEIDWQQRLFEKFLPDAVLNTVGVATVVPEIVAAAALARPFQGVLLKEALKDLEADRAALVRDAVRQGFVEGETVDQIVRRLRGTKAENYADGLMQGPRHYLEALVRTSINHTATYAKNAFYKANTDLVTGWVFTATLDGRTSLTCASLHGRRYDVDTGPMPPRHWRCLPGNTLVLSRSRITGASKRWFDGEVIVIKTASGRRLTSTPNHPILTDHGWVGSGSLNIGDRVVCDGGGEWRGIGDCDHQHMPASIHEVTSSFFATSQMRPTPMPLAAEDFHGDGGGSKIAVVASDRGLRVDRDSAIEHHIGKLNFKRRGASGAAGCIGGSHLNERLFADGPTTCGFIRGFGKFLSFLKAGVVHASNLLVGSIPRSPIIFYQNSYHRRTTTGKIFSNAGYPNTVVKHFEHGVSRQSNSTTAFGFVNQIASNGVNADVELASKLIDGFACPIFFDDVISIEIQSFHGDVFNLETELGAYSASGIITHNCRSTMVPVLKSWRNLGINIDEISPGTRASMNGQVPADITFNQWLKAQDQGVQDDVLGATRGKLFRTGQLPVTSFTNNKGVVYTLDQLRRRHAEVFEEVEL